MFISCEKCRALTRIEMEPPLGPPEFVLCSGCGMRYRLSISRPEPTVDEARYRYALAFANDHRIELASAYSVLEGVMSLEDAQVLHSSAAASPPALPREPPPPSAAPKGVSSERRTDPAADRFASIFSGKLTGTSTVADSSRPALPQPFPAPSPRIREPVGAATLPPAGPSTPRFARTEPAAKARVEVELPYDPEFEPAVREGTLTTQQAVERGERSSLAQRLSQRHRLPMALAFEVADRRLTIKQALGRKTVLESLEVQGTGLSISRVAWRLALFACAAVVLVGFGFQLRSGWNPFPRWISASPPVAPADSAPGSPDPVRPLDPAQNQTFSAAALPTIDSRGQLVQIVGPDPRSVLASFCTSGAGGRQPVEVVSTIPPDPGARMGIFRSLESPGSPRRAILIRKDPLYDRWSAGDGQNPIQTLDVPGVPTGQDSAAAPIIREER